MKKGLGWARRQPTGLSMEMAYDPGAWRSWGQRKYRARGVMLDQGLQLLLLIVKGISLPPPTPILLPDAGSVLLGPGGGSEWRYMLSCTSLHPLLPRSGIGGN